MRYGLSILLAALVVSCARQQAPSMSTPDSPDMRIAQLDSEQGPVRPNQSFARAAYESSLKHLQAIKAGEIPSSLSREFIEALPVPAEPRLDATGYWRLGDWLLESRSGDLALTYRPPQLEPRMEYVVTLKGDVETSIAPSLTVRKIHPRR
ncbi:hypothetical protein D7Y27_16005 [Corallococcus sp. AB004]|nr:hypothetical protein D7Y27_16005 [Corallococcus sp. AB004]